MATGLKVSIALMLMMAPALAQQQPSPSQLALSINQAIAQMAQQIERQQAEIDQLRKELAGKPQATDPKNEKH